MLPCTVCWLRSYTLESLQRHRQLLCIPAGPAKHTKWIRQDKTFIQHHRHSKICNACMLTINSLHFIFMHICFRHYVAWLYFCWSKNIRFENVHHMASMWVCMWLAQCQCNVQPHIWHNRWLWRVCLQVACSLYKDVLLEILGIPR